jgi:hypothetical protein
MMVAAARQHRLVGRTLCGFIIRGELNQPAG